MGTKITFSEQEAKDIDSSYDDGNLATGAFRQTEDTADAAGKMELFTSDAKYANFKANYSRDAKGILTQLPASWKTLYNTMNPVESPPSLPAERDAADAAAKAEREKAAEAERKRKEAEAAEKERTRLEAARAQAEAAAAAERARLTAEAESRANEQALQSSSDIQITKKSVLSADGRQRIPASWFFDYVDNNQIDPDGEGSGQNVDLASIFDPFRRILLDNDGKHVSLDHLTKIATPFAAKNEHSGWSWDNATESYNNSDGESFEEDLLALAGSEQKLREFRIALDLVIKYFQNKAQEFELSSVADNYKCVAYIDPKGYLSVQIYTPINAHYPPVQINHAFNSNSLDLSEQVNPTDKVVAHKALASLKAHVATNRFLSGRFDRAMDITQLTPQQEVVPEVAEVPEPAPEAPADAQNHPDNFSGVGNSLTFYGVLVDGGLDAIPSHWFNAYLDNPENSVLANTVAPIRNMLYDTATNSNYVTLDDLLLVAGRAESDTGDTAASYNPVVWFESWVNSAIQSEVASTGSNTALQAITETLIPHFAENTRYLTFEFTRTLGSTTSTYAVTAFVDPQGAVDVQVAESTLAEDYHPFYFSQEDEDLSANYPNDEKKQEVIKHAQWLVKLELERANDAACVDRLTEYFPALANETE